MPTPDFFATYNVMPSPHVRAALDGNVGECIKARGPLPDLYPHEVLVRFIEGDRQAGRGRDRIRKQ